jgi:uncharacterized protein DUF5684
MVSLLPILALMQYDDTTGGGGGIAGCLGGGVFMLIWLAVLVVVIAGMWKVFVKAGHPGWAAIVPFYNLYILTQIAGREILWFILLLIPGVNIIAAIMISLDIARKFGQGSGFGIGLAFLPFIFYPILGFGSAQYNPNA